MRIVVSGANGFVGSSFMSAFKMEHNLNAHSVVGLIRHQPNPDTSNFLAIDYSREALDRFIAEFRPDAWIHAAGSASVSLSQNQPEVDYASSVTMTTTILDALGASLRPPTFLYVSSAAVYGNPESLPVRENDDLVPISPYGRHRLQCEKLVADYSAATRARAVITRAFSLFGAKQRQLVLWEISKQAIENGKVVLQGTGDEQRDFLHVDEFVKRSIRLLNSEGVGCTAVNVASGESLKVRELAALIFDRLGQPSNVEALGKPQAGNPTSWLASIEKYHNLTGDFSRADLASALDRCLREWQTELRSS